MQGQASISGKIRVGIQGEVLDDKYSLGLYSTDASLYQIFPLCICLPKSKEDLIHIVEVANNYEVPVLARGGATSLAGQTVAKAIVIDYSKYLSKVIEYNPQNAWIEVEPGIIRESVNTIARQDNLHFAPDPATSNRATIGGMVANNSSGTKSIYYGKTSDHVLELEILLMNGDILHLKNLTEQELSERCLGESSESYIYKEFRNLIFENTQIIADKFPEVMRRVSGYALDSFTQGFPWNLSNLICGSEGTLGLILSAKIKLTPLPKAKILSVFHFATREKAICSVEEIVKFGPAAVEMLDYNILELSKENALCHKYYKQCIQDDPKAVLITEFYGKNSKEVEEKLFNCIDFLKNNGQGFAWPLFRTPDSMNSVWALRKQGLGLIMGNPGKQKPIPFIEDSSIPLKHLSEYVNRVENLCKSLDTNMVIYAHASVGVLHIRPFLDTREAKDLQKMKMISQQALEWVKEFGGSWSGEHGDGLVRSPRLKEYFGKEIIQCFETVKRLFDPKNLLNPGKIVNAQPMDQNLRYGLSYTENKWEPVFQFKESGSFEDIVHNCSGIGACRKLDGGTMCPSFKATLDEEHSTRGRANALRLAISGQLPEEDLPSKRLLQVFDLCLSCKACKTECPSNVDIAKLKSEVLQKKYDQGSMSLGEKLLRDSADWSRRNTGVLSGVINFIQSSSLFRNSIQEFLGFDSRRKLPKYSKESLVHWFQKRNRIVKNPLSKIVLFADTYSNYHDVHVGKAAVKLLESCGYEILIKDQGCCQRPRISNGFLKKAKSAGSQTIENLEEYFKNKWPIIVLEPSCESALKDDLPDLLDDQSLGQKLKSQVYLIDEFLYEQIQSGVLKGQLKSSFEKVLVHGHCHQKALNGLSGLKSFYKRDGTCTSEILDSGCCGMAGAFGYEKGHYEISEKIGELGLFPGIRQHPHHEIVANGFSCRHQIKDFMKKNAYHWVETIKYVAE